MSHSVLPKVKLEANIAAVPGTRWVQPKGVHAGAVVIIDREANGKVWFHRDKTVKAGGWLKDKVYWLYRLDFYGLYRPYTKKDEEICTGAARKNEPPPVPEVKPEIREQTEAWLAARRDGPVVTVVDTRQGATPTLHERTGEAEKTKACGHCKVVKPLSEFSRNARKKDGLQTYCKACANDAWRRFVAKRDAERATAHPKQQAPEPEPEPAATTPVQVDVPPVQLTEFPGFDAPLWRVHLRKVVVTESEVLVRGRTLIEAAQQASGEGVEILGVMQERPA